jgi:hypothetical protein
MGKYGLATGDVKSAGSMPPTGPAAAGTCPVRAVIDAIVTTAPDTTEAIHRVLMWSSFPPAVLRPSSVTSPSLVRPA